MQALKFRTLWYQVLIYDIYDLWKMYDIWNLSLVSLSTIQKEKRIVSVLFFYIHFVYYYFIYYMYDMLYIYFILSILFICLGVCLHVHLPPHLSVGTFAFQTCHCHGALSWGGWCWCSGWWGGGHWHSKHACSLKGFCPHVCIHSAIQHICSVLCCASPVSLGLALQMSKILSRLILTGSKCNLTFWNSLQNTFLD